MGEEERNSILLEEEEDTENIKGNPIFDAAKIDWQQVEKYKREKINIWLEELVEQLLIKQPEDPIVFATQFTRAIAKHRHYEKTKSSMSTMMTDHAGSMLGNTEMTKYHGSLYKNRLISSSLRLSIKELFDECDKNNDGLVSTDELHDILVELGLVHNHEQTRQWILDADQDNDGSLNLDEFINIVKNARDLSTKYFAQSKIEKKKNKRNETVDVFLGGSCNPTTWRKDVSIPVFEQAGISYYNPQVDDWDPSLLALENEAKESCKVLFFVLDPLTRALASMIEICELIAKGRVMVLVINEITEGQSIGGRVIHVSELKDLNRSRAYLADLAERHNVPAFKSVLEASLYTIEWLNTYHSGGTPSNGAGGTEAKSESKITEAATKESVKKTSGGDKTPVSS